MRILTAALLLVVLPGVISAVELERFAVVPPLAWGGLAALPPAQQLPIPKSVPAFRASAAPAAWILAVKKAYLSCPQGALPPAMAAELPLAAAQQMQWDSSTYPSKAYKIVLDGRAAFVIENDNFDALYVNIFDEAGAHIAYGGFDENYDFYWLTKNSR